MPACYANRLGERPGEHFQPHASTAADAHRAGRGAPSAPFVQQITHNLPRRFGVDRAGA